MTASPPDSPAVAPAALAAFLRGIERRAAVFATLLTGSAAVGDVEVAATLRRFHALAGQAPFAEWPRRFWALLLAAPGLRAAPQDPVWPAAFAALSTLGRGPRAALLLRLVAGLADIDAAAVLGVARPTYRLALQRALPHCADGSPDAAAWQALDAAAQAAIRQLPAGRMTELARQREAAIRGERAPPRRVRAARPPGAARWRSAQWSVVAATVLALAATWWWPAGHGAGDAGADGIRIVALPPAAAPAATYGDDARLVTHPDLELLLADEDTPAAADPGFHAWYAAQLAQLRSGDDAQPLPIGEPLAPAIGDVDSAAETADVPR